MNVLMQYRHKSSITAIFLALCLASAGAFAAPGGVPGKPGNTGGGNEAPDLGDLFILYRDDYGIPILTAESCQQPLAAAPIQELVDQGCDLNDPYECRIIPVDPITCAVQVGFETYTQEVDFGRTNVVRSPVSVFEAQLEDAVVKLATADCITLDPAGRLVTSTVDNGQVLTSAIDSPLQNLAIYRQLMLTGFLGAESNPLSLPGDTLDIAAMGVGAASDKTGEVNIDMVVYMNEIMGLTDESVNTLLPKKCIQVREEVKGVVQLVRKCFLDYSDGDGGPNAVDYNRDAHFLALPDPAYIPENSPVNGWFEYLEVVDPNIPSFQVAQGPILDTVPELSDAFAATNLTGFAKAADDARAVIDYMHTWAVPEEFQTPLTCEASGDATYDVSISSVSGLQVPVRMVAGTEGREFTLTVANAGPDTASGMVVLTAVDSNGAAVPTFPRSFDFTIIAGASQSWTEFFSVDSATTVTWTATAIPDCDTCDANPGNNSVTEITTVIGQGGGKGGGQGGGSGNKPN